MTTRLAGQSTRFLPFNRGHDGWAPGNPPNPDGHRTALPVGAGLAARRLARPARTGSSTSSRHRRARRQRSRAVIFPRYHQWDAVLRARRPTRATHGAGHDYLVQHSAGSGKSNTIAWLAHRLSTLHDADDAQGVRQGRRDHRPASCSTGSCRTRSTSSSTRTGVVAKIDKDSAQLADGAGRRAGARSSSPRCRSSRSCSTRSAELPAAPLRGDRRRGALVADRRGGEGPASRRSARRAEQELDSGRGRGREADGRADDPSRTRSPGASRRAGRQPNLSFFAFTATPKAQTLELFGTLRRRTARYEPFHLYSMRQAIEEGFILDVLANYTTYQTLLADREGDRRRPRRTTRRKAQARDRPVRRRCTRTTSRRRPRSSSSTSARTRATRSAARPRRWS